jgi:hypothetical protein
MLYIFRRFWGEGNEKKSRKFGESVKKMRVVVARRVVFVEVVDTLGRARGGECDS